MARDSASRHSRSRCAVVGAPFIGPTRRSVVTSGEAATDRVTRQDVGQGTCGER